MWIAFISAPFNFLSSAHTKILKKSNRNEYLHISTRIDFLSPPPFFQAFQPLIHVFLLRISLPSTPDIVERSKRGENGTGALAKSRQKVSSVEIAIFHSWTVFLTVSLSRKHCDLFARAVTNGDGGVRRQPILRIARRAINWIPRTRA